MPKRTLMSQIFKKLAVKIFSIQLRIRIEMAFGMLVTKWGVLQKPLKIPLRKIPKVFLACCMLHNYCIDERLESQGIPRIRKMYERNGVTLGYIPSDVGVISREGDSQLRRVLVAKVHENCLCRPNYNQLRRKFEDDRRKMYTSDLI